MCLLHVQNTVSREVIYVFTWNETAQLWKKHSSSSVTLCPCRLIPHLQSYTAFHLGNSYFYSKLKFIQ